MSSAEEMNGIWQLVKDAFKPQMENTTFDLWFKDLKVADYDMDNSIVTLSTDSEFKHRVIQDRFLPQIEERFSSILGFKVKVVVVYVLPDKDTEQTPDSQVPGSVDTLATPSSLQDFNFKYTFENFIVGESNNFAHAACMAVANTPAERYNPLFIYGPSGLGKTHLLRSIINEVKKKKPKTKIVYVNGEDFTNELIESISKQSSKEFKNKYRSCDILMIDDIQFIAGKPSTQEEFFHTFNTLFENHKQIVLTSDRPPKDIQPLENRLLTRFEWGLIADIQPPNLELRIAIIKKKAEQVNVNVPNDVLMFLAENLRSNIRQIEGSIIKLAALSLVTGTPINLQMAEKCINELLGGQESVETTISKIFKATEARYGFSREELCGKDQTRNIAAARHVVIYLIRKITDMSFPSIGKIFSKDHTTIMSAIKNVERKILNDPAYAKQLEEIEDDVKK
ncbi:MAG: chromosomal replication initiator protein DnaA [Clostridia bacterium]|nr:chromosomal replication initiator protein DnaA [Clostridia bacterium]